MIVTLKKCLSCFLTQNPTCLALHAGLFYVTDIEQIDLCASSATTVLRLLLCTLMGFAWNQLEETN